MHDKRFILHVCNAVRCEMPSPQWAVGFVPLFDPNWGSDNSFNLQVVNLMSFCILQNLAACVWRQTDRDPLSSREPLAQQPYSHTLTHTEWTLNMLRAENSFQIIGPFKMCSCVATDSDLVCWTTVFLWLMNSETVSIKAATLQRWNIR